jgi:ADP-glucose pyrophosphorylase
MAYFRLLDKLESCPGAPAYITSSSDYIRRSSGILGPRFLLCADNDSDNSLIIINGCCLHNQVSNSVILMR